MGWNFTWGTGDFRRNFAGGLVKEVLGSRASFLSFLLELKELVPLAFLYAPFSGWSRLKFPLLTLLVFFLPCSVECFRSSLRRESTVSLSLPFPWEASNFLSSLAAALSRSWACTFLNSSTISYSLGPGAAVAWNFGVPEKESSDPFFDVNKSDSSRFSKPLLFSFCLFLFRETCLFCLEKSGFLLWPPELLHTMYEALKEHFIFPNWACEWL